MFRRRSPAAILAAIVVFPSAARSDAPASVSYAGHRLVQVVLESAEDVQTMLSISQDHWSEGVGVGVVDFRVPPEGIAALDAAKIPYVVLIDDVGALIDAERQRLAGGGIAGGVWFLDFKTYEEVNAYLETLEALRPDLATVFPAGTSLEGRAIQGIRITAPGGGSRPAVLLNGCQHAREWIAVMVPMFIADRLVRDYDIDPVIQGLVDTVEFLIVPIVNPDGYVYTWGPDRLWRKNRRNNGDGTFGVDPNRNWDYEWGGEGSSGNTNSETYRGTAPFSEPETQVMRDLYLANPQVVANIDFHSYSQLVLWPWGWTSDLPADSALFDALGQDMSGAILSVHGMTYVQGPVYNTLYPASGVSIDWTYGDQGVFSYTIELRPDSGNPGFILPPEEIIPTGEEALAAIVELGAFAVQGPQFSFPSGLPGTLVAGEATDVLVDISPISSPLLGGSEQLFARVGSSGPFAGSALQPLGGVSFQGTLPAAPCGEVVQFYFQVQTMDGATHRSPPGAPDSWHEATAYEVAVEFADDFETDQGWTVQGDAADGQWDRGVPIPTSTCDRGNPGTDGDGSGSCYLTDNSSANGCNSDVDAGSTTLVSPIMDASDPAVAISYRRWYSNTQGADPMNDTFVVEASDDGGASWAELEVVGPGGSEVDGGWYVRQFLIADIPGITNTAQFRIRFTASDLGSGSVVEAAVDGVVLEALGCPPTTGPDLDGDGIVGIADLLILLGAWGPCPAPPAPCPADIDGDGIVGITDLLALLSSWG